MAPEKYVVKQGDCISSIAFKHDLFPEALWNHPDNSKLKQDRKEPNTLIPGDEVVIPDKETKEEDCGPEQKHRFRRKGVPERLRIRFLDDDDEPRADIAFVVEIERENGGPCPLRKGNTDDQGYLDVSIPPDGSTGKIYLGEGIGREIHEVLLGHLDPIDTLSGQKARLNNMAYSCGDEKTDEIDQVAWEAIREFQKDNDLPVLARDATEIDQDTVDKIEEKYNNS